jgi:hypothetical protein
MYIVREFLATILDGTCFKDTRNACYKLCLLQFEGKKKMREMRISKLFLKTFMLRGVVLQAP